MRNFLRIAAGIDTLPVLSALAAMPDLWNEHTLRTAHPGTAHAAVDDIWIWFNDTSGDVVNDIQTHPRRAWREIPALRPMILDLMRRVEGTQLGRVIITRLPPGKEITPHVDQGAPATFFTRFQIALQSFPGALFHAGNETVNFRCGEVWQFNNQAEHSVVNNSADDRIVIIVDIRTAA